MCPRDPAPVARLLPTPSLLQVLGYLDLHDPHMCSSHSFSWPWAPGSCRLMEGGPGPDHLHSLQCGWAPSTPTQATQWRLQIDNSSHLDLLPGGILVVSLETAQVSLPWPRSSASRGDVHLWRSRLESGLLGRCDLSEPLQLTRCIVLGRWDQGALCSLLHKRLISQGGAILVT